ncbi:MAG: 3'-5' exoribonuclease YhaM [Myxococcota bacterium]|nr:3'-5' exoribonuclease YhaM [Myxococcota bacterium]
MGETRKIFVESIRDRDRVATVFLVKHKAVPLSRNGKPYLALVLQDRTGAIEARVFDDVEDRARLFDAMDYLWVEGAAHEYQGRLQLKLDRLEKIPADRVDISNFVATAGRNPDDMIAELRVRFEQVVNPHLKAFLLGFLADRDFLARYRVAPAAKTIHHAMMGGLLVHTLSLARLADNVVDCYPHLLNRDLMIAGVFLHDIGKVHELSVNGQFGYTDIGKLVGHITIGVEMISARARQVDGFPEDLEMILKHLVLSHHGRLEFGSPKRPKTMEALALSALDELDSRLDNWYSIMLDDPSDKWTAFQPMYERYLMKLPGYLRPEGFDHKPKPAAPAADGGASGKPRQEMSREDLKFRPFQGLAGSQGKD